VRAWLIDKDTPKVRRWLELDGWIDAGFP